MRRTPDSVEHLERKAAEYAEFFRRTGSRDIYLYPRAKTATAIQSKVEVAFLTQLVGRPTRYTHTDRAYHTLLRSKAEELGYTIHEWTPNVEEIT